MAYSALLMLCTHPSNRTENQHICVQRAKELASSIFVPTRTALYGRLIGLGLLQVHIYLPEESHPANNLVRAIVKDGNDNYTSLMDGVFLDSGKDARNAAANLASRSLDRSLASTSSEVSLLCSATPSKVKGHVTWWKASWKLVVLAVQMGK